MRFTVQINCDNAAFADDPTAEVSRMMRELADRLEGASPDESYPLRDYNGNKVGFAVFRSTEE